LRDTGFTQRSFVNCNIVSINGAATNNLQATTVPTNGGATYTGRLLGSKKKGRTYAGYFEYGFRVREQHLIKWSYLEPKKYST
jgi:hypothetical protein